MSDFFRYEILRTEDVYGSKETFRMELHKSLSLPQKGTIELFLKDKTGAWVRKGDLIDVDPSDPERAMATGAAMAPTYLGWANK
jgi:hypothetical protein